MRWKQFGLNRVVVYDPSVIIWYIMSLISFYSRVVYILVELVLDEAANFGPGDVSNRGGLVAG